MLESVETFAPVQHTVARIGTTKSPTSRLTPFGSKFRPTVRP